MWRWVRPISQLSVRHISWLAWCCVYPLFSGEDLGRLLADFGWSNFTHLLHIDLVELFQCCWLSGLVQVCICFLVADVLTTFYVLAEGALLNTTIAFVVVLLDLWNLLQVFIIEFLPRDLVVTMLLTRSEFSLDSPVLTTLELVASFLLGSLEQRCLVAQFASRWWLPVACQEVLLDSRV